MELVYATLRQKLHLLALAAHIAGLKEAMLCEISGLLIIELNILNCL